MTDDYSEGPPAYQGPNGQRLAVRQVYSAGSPGDRKAANSPQVVFCGGFHSNMLGGKASELAKLSAERQWSFTRFDYRGHGESDGKPAEFTLHDWLADTLMILDSIAQPVIMVGSSMGAWLATRAALARPEQVKGLLLLAAAPDFLQELVEPYLSPAQIWDLQQAQIVELANNYDLPFPITQALLDSGRELSLLSPPVDSSLPGLDVLDCPVHLLHGAHDTDVPFELSIRLMKKLTHDQAQLTLLHKADHRLSDERSLQAIRDELVTLVDRIFTTIPIYDQQRH